MCDLTVPPSKLTSQKIHGYRNKIWTHEWPSERKQEKNLDTWRSKNIKRIIDMSSKEFTMERERIIQKGVQQIISIYISIHIHKYIHIYIYIYMETICYSPFCMILSLYLKLFCESIDECFSISLTFLRYFTITAFLASLCFSMCS
jgi:hypothetical protein